MITVNALSGATRFALLLDGAERSVAKFNGFSWRLSPSCPFRSIIKQVRPCCGTVRHEIQHRLTGSVPHCASCLIMCGTPHSAPYSQISMPWDPSPSCMFRSIIKQVRPMLQTSPKRSHIRGVWKIRLEEADREDAAGRYGVWMLTTRELADWGQSAPPVPNGQWGQSRHFSTIPHHNQAMRNGSVTKSNTAWKQACDTR